MIGTVVTTGTVVAPDLLTVAGLHKRFGDYDALVDIRFDVRAGEILGIIGPNGAGKTTLMECLVGLQPVDAGRFTWRTAPLPAADRKRHFFYLPDGIAPWGELTARSVLDFFADQCGRGPADLDRVIERLRLSPVLAKPVAALSKGYRRRLLLVLALLSPQPLVMLDEPFDGFDLKQTLEAVTLLRELAGAGRTLMLSIHQLADAARICDRFLLLGQGKVLGLGSLEELMAQAGVTAGGLEEVFLALA
ncbi:MAG: ATP-binding cassette domain-containing protein [Nitrospirae bacterium]|nr:ATP-binding cassette domain-containing protein [Nitrospirota bacterium]